MNDRDSTICAGAPSVLGEALKAVGFALWAYVGLTVAGYAVVAGLGLSAGNGGLELFMVSLVLDVLFLPLEFVSWIVHAVRLTSGRIGMNAAIGLVALLATALVIGGLLIGGTDSRRGRHKP